jgi:uncharacterized membrane protein YsdA (DUF1294 family)
MMWILAVIAYWLVVNWIAFTAFGYDKSLAVNGLRRMPEAHLLMLAMLGGSVGAFAGRQHFRHKTRKQPFTTQLQIIAMLQTGILAGLVIAFAPIG